MITQALLKKYKIIKTFFATQSYLRVVDFIYLILILICRFLSLCLTWFYGFKLSTQQSAKIICKYLIVLMDLSLPVDDDLRLLRTGSL